MNTVVKDMVEALEISLSLLNVKDKAFAASLIAGYNKYGKLSDKQLYWVQKLLDRALGKEIKAEIKKVSVGNFSGVYALFEKAKGKLKYPKIHLVADGKPVVIYKAGERSKTPGEIQVTDGGPFGNNRYYGRVSKDGEWTPGRGTFPEFPQVEGLLKKLGESPDEVAREYGKLHGRCCFCGLKLEDERSTAAGYGPVCAKNYGLEDKWKHAVSVFDKKAA